MTTKHSKSIKMASQPDFSDSQTRNK